MEGEFQALQAPYPNRGHVSDEYLRLLKTLWSDPTPSFHGDYFRLSDVTVSPMPVQQPHPPIWIGGWSRAAARRAVDYGDYWHPTIIGPEELSRKVRYMREYSDAVGRESPPQLSFRADLEFGSAGPAERPPLQGSTGQVIADIQQFALEGVSHMIMQIAGESYSDKFRTMERFMNEVKPRVPV